MSRNNKNRFVFSLLHHVCQELAEWYFQDGCSVLAACCHLAVDNIQVGSSRFLQVSSSFHKVPSRFLQVPPDFSRLLCSSRFPPGTLQVFPGSSRFFQVSMFLHVFQGFSRFLQVFPGFLLSSEAMFLSCSRPWPAWSGETSWSWLRAWDWSWEKQPIRARLTAWSCWLGSTWRPQHGRHAVRFYVRRFRVCCWSVRTSVVLRELSADLLQMIPDNHVLLAKLCAFHPGSAAEINQLHQRVRRPRPRLLFDRILWDLNRCCFCRCSAAFPPWMSAQIWR